VSSQCILSALSLNISKFSYGVVKLVCKSEMAVDSDMPTLEAPV
jgi:hypothetical protein